MVKKIVFSVLILLLVIPIAIALDTQITVKAPSGADVVIRGLNLEGKSIPDAYFNEMATGDGEITTNFSLTDSIIKLSVITRNADQSKVKVFKDVPTAKIIYIDFTQEEPVPVITDIIVEAPVVENATDTNSTENQTELLTETDTQSPLTGKVTGFNLSAITNNSRIIIYAVGLVLVIGVVTIFIVRTVKKRKKSGSPGAGFPVFSEFKKRFGSDEEEEAQLDAAEKRIKQVEEDIKRLKERKGKIKEYETRLKEDQEMLRKLKSAEE